MISDKQIMAIVNAANIFPGNQIKDIGEAQKNKIREVFIPIFDAAHAAGVAEERKRCLDLFRIRDENGYPPPIEYIERSIESEGK